MCMFEMSDIESDRFYNWYEEHECLLKKDAGAIGGRLTFSFTPTGVGCAIKIACGCGEEIDVTDNG